MLLVIRLIVKYIQDEDLCMWGLQILVCCSCLGLKVHMKYLKQSIRKFEDWHCIQH